MQLQLLPNDFRSNQKKREAFLESFTARFARLRRQLAADESTPLAPEMHRFTSRRRKAANGTEMGLRSLCSSQLDNRKIARSKRQTKFERAVQRSVCISVMLRILTTSLASSPASTKKPSWCVRKTQMECDRGGQQATRRGRQKASRRRVQSKAPILGYKRPQIRWRLVKEHPLRCCSSGQRKCGALLACRPNSAFPAGDP